MVFLGLYSIYCGYTRCLFAGGAGGKQEELIGVLRGVSKAMLICK